MVIIRAEGFASGVSCPHEGRYLKSFDHDACGGQGWGEFTSDVAEAKRFLNLSDAMLFWRRTSKTRPLRADGKPNRPLTSLTVTVVPIK